MLEALNFFVELSDSEASNRGRGNYLKHFFKSAEKIINRDEESRNLHVVINNFAIKNFESNDLYILDISDAILTPPKSYSFLKRLYQKLIVNPRRVAYLRSFDAVVCACAAQARVLEKYISNVYIVPDVSFYHKKYVKKRALSIHDKIIFVWEGQGHNFPYVKELIDRNRDFFKKPDILLRIITDPINEKTGFSNEQYIKSLNINSEFIEWDQKTFIDYVGSAHIGIAIVDTYCKHAMFKPDNKLVNYLGLGLPTIASGTEAYVNFNEQCKESSIICFNNEDWTNALEFFRKHKEIIVQNGIFGRDFVLNNYDESNLILKWNNVIKEVHKFKK